MTRDEIEEARAFLKTYFPNKSEDRATFNRICDQAVVAAKVANPGTRCPECGGLVYGSTRCPVGGRIAPS
jgi:hypothetical protein